MNSIDGVLVRIQEILNRIQQIRETDGRVTGNGPAALPHVVAPKQPQGPNAVPATSSQTASAAARNVQFQRLVEDLIASGTGSPAAGGANGTGLPSGNLGGLGSLSTLESVLGSSASTAGLGSGSSSPNAALLQRYQRELVQAIRDLEAQQQKDTSH